MATAKQLDDITECPICTEVYTDPRVLPCGHTYCLKCIEAWSKDKQPGDELACPLCRKEFTLTSNGVSDLPKNFFLQKFLQAIELSSVESKTSPCEACNGGEVATVYCVECQQKLCRACEEDHRKFKVTRLHNTVDIGDKIAKDAVFEALPAYCEQHKGDPLRIYCLDCKLAICMLCYIKSHNGHKCSDVNEVKDDLSKQMTSDIDSVSARGDRCREMLHSLENEKKEFIGQVEKAGVEISEKAEQLKRMIDDHKEKLMNELSSVKQKRMKKIESLREEIERQLMSMESYTKYVDEVRQKGTACDIARAASGLHDRADELLTFDVIERSLDDLGHAVVTFTSSVNAMNSVINRAVGRLRMDIDKAGDVWILSV